MFEARKYFKNPVMKSVEVDDKDWELIQSQMINPGLFEKKDVRSYKSWLANNFPDRSNERLPISFLKTLSDSLAGKSVLFNGHEWGPPGSGRWYTSNVEKVTKEQVLEHIKFKPNKQWLKKLDLVEEHDSGLYYMQPKFYTLTIHPAVPYIDAGIIRDQSIGFRAPKRNQIADGKGNLLWYEFDNSEQEFGESVEGSFVFLGDQFGAGTRKSFVVNYPNSQTKEGEKTMFIQFKSLGIGATVDADNEQSVKAFTDMVEAKIAEILKGEKQAKDDLTAFKAVFGKTDITVEEAKVEIKKLGEQANAYKKGIVDEALKFAEGTGLLKKDQVETRRKALETAALDELLIWRDTYKKAFEERNPGVGQLHEPEDGTTKEVQTPIIVSTGAY